MKCGHVENSKRVMDDGTRIPACAICLCTETEKECQGNEGLEDREARCHCGKLVPARWDLAFFEYRGEGSYKAHNTCKNCGYFKSAHPFKRHECEGFEPYGTYKYDKPTKVYPIILIITDELTTKLRCFSDLNIPVFLLYAKTVLIVVPHAIKTRPKAFISVVFCETAYLYSFILSFTYNISLAASLIIIVFLLNSILNHTTPIIPISAASKNNI